jgi:hypothetical protein
LYCVFDLKEVRRLKTRLVFIVESIRHKSSKSWRTCEEWRQLCSRHGDNINSFRESRYNSNIIYWLGIRVIARLLFPRNQLLPVAKRREVGGVDGDNERIPSFFFFYYIKELDFHKHDLRNKSFQMWASQSH